MSKFDQNRIRWLRKTLHKQKQTNKHYQNNGHLAVNQYNQHTARGIHSTRS